MIFFKINKCLRENFAHEHMRQLSCNEDDKNVSFSPPFHYLSQCFMEYKMTRGIVCFGPQAKPRLQREGSCASLHNSLMRNSIFQLMIHTLDPLSDESKRRLFCNREKKKNVTCIYF